VRNTKVWLRLLGLVRTVLEAVVFDEDTDAVVVSVRPRKGARQRCGRCGRRAAWYDRGEEGGRWRSLDLGELRCFLEADAPRVSCPSTVRRLSRFHGPATAPATRWHSTTRWPGWRPIRQRRPWSS